MAPVGPLIPPQPRVYFRNQPFLPSRAPRSANISPILSTLRILPVATGLPTMVGVYPCSLALCLCASACPDLVGVANPICRPFVFSCLQTLFLSLRSFPRSRRLFSTACSLFSQNTGGVGVRLGFCRTPNLQPRTSAATRALDTAGGGAYGSAQRSRGNRKLR